MAHRIMTEVTRVPSDPLLDDRRRLEPGNG
jgi:hypothetical protein